MLSVPPGTRIGHSYTSGMVSAHAATLLMQAAQAQREGRGAQALELYRQVVEHDPSNVLALSHLAADAMQRGEPGPARTLLEAAVHAQPQSVEAWMALGNACARLSDHARAATAFSQVTRLRPDLAAGHLNLGNALRRAGRPDAALDALRRGVALDDGLAVGHFNLGLALDEQGQHAAAIDAFEAALRRDAGHAAARSALGNALLRAGQPGDALACFERVLREAPAFPGAHHNRGVALQALGRDAEAVEAFQGALSLQPDRQETRNNLIVSLIRAGDARAALDACDAYEAMSPRHPRALAYRAAALLELGRRKEAAGLLDFDRLALSSVIAVPPGFETLHDFNAALAAQVLGHATLAHEPAGKSTRGGSQTGEFTHGNDGAAAALRASIVQAVHAYLAQVRERLPGHPFTASLPARWRLATWAVALQSQGYQRPHFHPDGRISGVYYVAVPDAVRHAADHAGALEFGRTTGTDAIGGQAQPLLHLVTPQPGRMVLFPSYFYHRTLPFASAQPRISVAFDVLPAG